MKKSKLIAIIILLLLFTGVFTKVFLHKKGNTVTRCIEYMNNRYSDDKFEYIGPINEFQPTRSSCEVYVRSEKFPDEEIYVWILRNEDGTVEYGDNYLSYKFRNQVEETLSTVANDVLGENRAVMLIRRNMIDWDIFDNKTSFSEFIGNELSLITCCILLPPGISQDDKEDKLKKVYEILLEKNLICSLKVYYTTNEDKYRGYKAEDILANDRGWWSAYGYIEMHQDLSKYAYLGIPTDYEPDELKWFDAENIDEVTVQDLIFR